MKSKVLFIIFQGLSATRNCLRPEIGPLISKFMTSQPGKQTIAIHILLNISRSKGSQTMQCGQLHKT